MKESVDYTRFPYHTLRRRIQKHGVFYNIGLGTKNVTYLVPKSTLDDIMRESFVPGKQGGR
jgi:hypothetical protein